MSRVYRSVYSRLFDDLDYQRLTPRARHVLLTVRLCAEAGPAAIFRYRSVILAEQTGYPPRQVLAALDELDRAGWTLHDERVVWVRNGLRYDPVGLRSPNLRRAVEALVTELPASSVVARFCDYYDLRTVPRTPPEPIANGSPNLSPDQRAESREQRTESREEPSLLSPAEQAPPPPPPLMPWGTPDDLVALYNAVVPEGHPHVTRLSPARREKARRYLRSFPDRAFWTRTFSEIRHSVFLRGLRNGTGHEHFVADFDWLLTRGKDGSENAVKVAEGKYRDG